MKTQETPSSGSLPRPCSALELASALRDGWQFAVLVDYDDDIRDVARARFDEWFSVGARGFGYFDAKTDEMFIALCERYHVEVVGTLPRVPNVLTHRTEGAESSNERTDKV